MNLLRVDESAAVPSPMIQLPKLPYGMEALEPFVTAGIGQFGSGWVWLIQDNETVRIIKSSNAETPEAYGRNALLTCDVWEHAYYLDYQNRRKDYLTAFLDNLANWEFASSRLN